MWELLIVAGLKFIEWYLDRQKADKKVIQSFYDFVEKFASDGSLKSVKLHDSYEAQLSRLRKKLGRG